MLKIIKYSSKDICGNDKLSKKMMNVFFYKFFDPLNEKESIFLSTVFYTDVGGHFSSENFFFFFLKRK